jgi:hypothetical protein
MSGTTIHTISRIGSGSIRSTVDPFRGHKNPYAALKAT